MDVNENRSKRMKSSAKASADKNPIESSARVKRRRLMEQKYYLRSLTYISRRKWKDQFRMNRLPIDSAALIVQIAHERRKKSLKVLQSVHKTIRTRLACNTI